MSQFFLKKIVFWQISIFCFSANHIQNIRCHIGDRAAMQSYPPFQFTCFIKFYFRYEQVSPFFHDRKSNLFVMLVKKRWENRSSSILSNEATKCENERVVKFYNLARKKVIKEKTIFFFQKFKLTIQMKVNSNIK